MTTSILPINESQTQRDIEKIGSLTLAKFDVSKLTINPLECDESLLPHLAVDFDVSIAGLSVDEARTYLSNARQIKKYIGSKYAVRKAAEAIFGDEIKVEPWNEHEGVPGTYKIKVNVTPQKSVTDENLNKAQTLIKAANRKSCHLSGITINMKNSGMHKYACITQSRESISVLPKILKDIETNVRKKVLVAVHAVETLIIRPLGV